MGGGISRHGGFLTVSNSILWGNSVDGTTDEEAQIDTNEDDFPVVNYCCIQGWTGDLGGVGNIGADPLLLNSIGDDGVPGTDDDDLRLSLDSPCIDAADNEALPADTFDQDSDDDVDEPIPFDLDGNARQMDDPGTDDTGNGTAPLVDMGAYEFPPCEGDVNGDGSVDPLDSGFVLARFGCEYPDDGMNCLAADANGDGNVDPLDSGFVLARFGDCP